MSIKTAHTSNFQQSVTQDPRMVNTPHKHPPPTKFSYNVMKIHSSVKLEKSIFTWKRSVPKNISDNTLSKGHSKHTATSDSTFTAPAK